MKKLYDRSGDVLEIMLIIGPNQDLNMDEDSFSFTAKDEFSGDTIEATDGELHNLLMM